MLFRSPFIVITYSFPSHDRRGITQVVFNPEFGKDAHEKAHALRNEYVITIKGIVKARDAENVNPNLKTGEIEVFVNELAQAKASEASAGESGARARQTDTVTPLLSDYYRGLTNWKNLAIGSSGFWCNYRTNQFAVNVKIAL